MLQEVEDHALEMKKVFQKCAAMKKSACAPKPHGNSQECCKGQTQGHTQGNSQECCKGQAKDRWQDCCKDHT